jgi:hypothetical protein
MTRMRWPLNVTLALLMALMLAAVAAIVAKALLSFVLTDASMHSAWLILGGTLMLLLVGAMVRHRRSRIAKTDLRRD